jgi:hypothetical protein
MEQRDLLLRVVEALERASIQYAITGSWASISYGVPRTTHDIDIVVVLSVEQARQLAEFFPPPFYADAVWMQEAARQGQFFNIIDPTTGLKIDFWPMDDSEFAQERFARRQPIKVFGRTMWMLSPEDIILSKLLWYQQSESETQWRDIVGVWRVQQNQLDLTYLKLWAARLSLTDLLARITNNK